MPGNEKRGSIMIIIKNGQVQGTLSASIIEQRKFDHPNYAELQNRGYTGIPSQKNNTKDKKNGNETRHSTI